MSRRHIPKWIVTTIAATQVVTAGAATAQTRPVPSDTVPMFAFAIDPAAVAAGLRPLRGTPLAPKEREIRVWTGFGYGIPDDLYRIRVSDGEVRGDVILWWLHDSEWGPDQNGESMHASVRRAFRCGPIKRHKMMEACYASLAPIEPDWRQLLAQLDSRGVSTLRTPAPPDGSTHGFHVVVETREGATYRAAYFGNPSPDGPGDMPRLTAMLVTLERLREAHRR